jgi:hypothetical protein
MKEILAILSVSIGFAGYLPYFRGVLQRVTKPHLFSWVIWGTLNGTAFAVQIAEGAGMGAALTGATAFICFMIAGLSVRSADKTITRSDWCFLLAAIVAIVVWLQANSAALSILLLATIDAIGFGPSIRKAFRQPFAENPYTFLLQSIAFFCSILALQQFSFETAFFPISLGIVNGGFAWYIFWRRKIVSNL